MFPYVWFLREVREIRVLHHSALGDFIFCSRFLPNSKFLILLIPDTYSNADEMTENSPLFSWRFKTYCVQNI